MTAKKSRHELTVDTFIDYTSMTDADALASLQDKIYDDPETVIARDALYELFDLTEYRALQQRRRPANSATAAGKAGTPEVDDFGRLTQIMLANSIDLDVEKNTFKDLTFIFNTTLSPLTNVAIRAWTIRKRSRADVVGINQPRLMNVESIKACRSAP